MRVITAFHLNNLQQFSVQAEGGKGGSLSISVRIYPRAALFHSLQTAERLLPCRSAGNVPPLPARLLGGSAGGPRRWLAAKLRYLPDTTEWDHFESQGQTYIYIGVLWTSFSGL